MHVLDRKEGVRERAVGVSRHLDVDGARKLGCPGEEPCTRWWWEVDICASVKVSHGSGILVEPVGDVDGPVGEVCGCLLDGRVQE